ncbi:MAG: M3 family oligoendopeptidase [Hyphomicrobiaceae bacterium]
MTELRLPDTIAGALATPEAATGRSAASQLGELPEWNLADLYASPASPQIEADLDRARIDAIALKSSYQGKLAELAGSDGLAEPIRAYEALQDRLGRLGSFAVLHYSGDRSDPERSKFFGDMQEKLTAIGTDLLFFELELNMIDDAVIKAAMARPALAHYAPWIEDLRREKPYQLDDRIETLFHEKSITGRGAFNRLFNETMSGLTFTVEGETLGLEPTLNLLSDPREARRHAAADALAKVFKENIRLFTLITNTLAKDKEISDRWRGFGDVAASRHLANRVEPEVVEALVTAVRSRYQATAHRYYAMKARWLGLDKLSHWDRNAPLPEQSDRKIPWGDARRTVIGAYRSFSPRMAEIADDFFEKRWIDAPVREGKAPGAFAHPTVPSAHPYVLLNYLGKPRDVMTLAHELGHGVHQVLANSQGPLMAPTPLTLAETASVFGEMLTFRAMLAATTEKRERKALIAAKVEDMIATLIRQIAFYQFERKVHQGRREGELTGERIGEMWMSVQGESLGPAVELKEGYETFWCYIPHFIHSPFYVYAYAFGDCLVNSLYALYENAHPGFVEKYFAMLSAGGSKHHSELLKPFGLDATKPEFWLLGLKVLEGLIDELEGMEG